MSSADDRATAAGEATELEEPEEAEELSSPQEIPSYQKINYGLRPAKQIERKMLVETFRRLSVLGAVEAYRYIGFGSIYFSDFYLIHKALGITNMISIEHHREDESRFRFNLPFSCIDMRFGEATEVLAELSWDAPTILWLDYDYSLAATVLAGVAFFIANAPPGSVLAVTVDADIKEPNEEDLSKLTTELGRSRIPAGLDAATLRGWGTASVFKDIINSEIQSTLTARNGPRRSNEIHYQQLFDFNYSDGTRMLTTGGILYTEFERRHLDGAFTGLDFLKTDAASRDAYEIRVPKLTYRELRHLDKQLPCDTPSDLQAEGIPHEDLERYSQVYRYFPTFAETDI